MTAVSSEEIVKEIVNYFRNTLPDSNRIWRIYSSWEEGKQFLPLHAYLVVVSTDDRREYGVVGQHTIRHQIDVALYFAVSSDLSFVQTFEQKLERELMQGLQNHLFNTFGAYFFNYSTRKSYLEEYRYKFFEYTFTVELFETLP